jgi:hypothetical protein
MGATCTPDQYLIIVLDKVAARSTFYEYLVYYSVGTASFFVKTALSLWSLTFAFCEVVID